MINDDSRTLDLRCSVLSASIDATFKDGVDHLEFKKLKEELAEKDKALSHSNKVYDGLLQQHENLKSEYERSKASRATKKAAARANDEAAEELERLKEEHAKSSLLSMLTVFCSVF